MYFANSKSMWTNKVSIKTNAAKTGIWKLWTDVENWKTWDNQVVDSSLDGDFILGQTGELTPKGGPKGKFELVEVTKNKSFISRSKLPLAKMDFIHSMEEKNGEIIITHKIQISGFSTFLFSRVIGKKIIQELPKALEELVKLAEKKENE